MEKPLISIVLCTWNGERFLEQQIESLLKQTYRPLEIIISDDASTDATCAILKRYEKNPIFRIWYQDKNTGIGENFHFTSKQAKGDFIAYADQDDIWMENKIEMLYASIGDALLVYSNSELVDEAGNSLYKTTADVRKMYTGCDSRGYILYSVVWGHGMLINRRLLENALPIPAGIHHDVWLAFKAITLGGIVYLDEVLTKYRQHVASTSKTIRQNVPQRKLEQRYEDFLKRKRWIELMMEHEKEEMKPFYKQMLELYSKKEKGKFLWPLVSFMLKYRKELFMFSRKNYFSQVVEILKQARGERISRQSAVASRQS